MPAQEKRHDADQNWPGGKFISVDDHEHPLREAEATPLPRAPFYDKWRESFLRRYRERMMWLRGLTATRSFRDDPFHLVLHTQPQFFQLGFLSEVFNI